MSQSSNIVPFAPQPQKLHVSTAWVQGLLSEHSSMMPTQGQFWSLLQDGVRVCVRLEMINVDVDNEGKETFHFLDEDSNSRFSLSPEEFLKAEPIKLLRRTSE